MNLKNVHLASGGCFINGKDYSHVFKGPGICATGDLRIDSSGVYINGRKVPDNGIAKEFEADILDKIVLNLTLAADSKQALNIEAREVTINGSPGSVSTGSGKVEVNGDVKGSVESASGGIRVKGGIGGSVRTASGAIHCGGSIKGSASTVSGDIEAEQIDGPTRSTSGSTPKPKTTATTAVARLKKKK